MADLAGPVGGVADHRLRPRRRGERLLAAVHAAVLAELGERGYAALTVEAVAARAGTSKASLYRRWPGKRQLVLAAVAVGVPEPEDLPGTGSLRGDLVAYLVQVSAHLQGPAGAALRGLVGEDPGAPDGPAELDERVQRRRSTDRLHALAARAVARGELGADRLDGVTARQWEAGPAVLRSHFLAEGAISEELCAEIVDEVMLPLLTRGEPSGPREDEGRP